MKAITQEMFYNAKVVLLPLGILLLLWWPAAVVGGAIVLAVLGIILLLGYLHLRQGIVAGQSIFTRNRTLSLRHLSQDLIELEQTTIRMFQREADDRKGGARLRFAAAINALESDEGPLPEEFSLLFTKKLLYEYQRKTGSLRYRLGSREPLLNGGELMRRLPSAERPAFMEFCQTIK